MRAYCFNDEAFDTPHIDHYALMLLQPLNPLWNVLIGCGDHDDRGIHRNLIDNVVDQTKLQRRSGMCGMVIDPHYGVDGTYLTSSSGHGTADHAGADDNELHLVRTRARLSRQRWFCSGNPTVMRELTRVGFQSRTLMEWVLRIMANLLRPDELAPAEVAYKMVAAMVKVGPEP